MTTYTLVLTILSFVIPTLFTLGVILDSYYSQYMDWLEDNLCTEFDVQLFKYIDWRGRAYWLTIDQINDLREDATNTTHDTTYDESHGPEVYDDEEEYLAQYPMARETATSCHCTGRDMCNVCWWPRDLGAPTCDVQGCDTETSGTVKYCKPCAASIKELEQPVVASNDYSAFEDDIPF